MPEFELIFAGEEYIIEAKNIDEAENKLAAVIVSVISPNSLVAIGVLPTATCFPSLAPALVVPANSGTPTSKPIIKSEVKRLSAVWGSRVGISKALRIVFPTGAIVSAANPDAPAKPVAKPVNPVKAADLPLSSML